LITHDEQNRHPMNMKYAIAFLAVFVLTSQSPLRAANNLSRPNIIVMLIDDLGYGDVGAFGCPDIPTPHIDSLARDGVRCLNGYTLCPVCSPSRAGLTTGLYPQRFRVNGNLNRGEPIPAEHPTLAECLRDAGYVTGMVGRWDLGDAKQGPLDRGFREVAKRPPGNSKVAGSPTYLGKDGTYWTEIQGGELADFIERHQQERFFLYFAPLAVHSPVEDVPAKSTNLTSSAGPARCRRGRISPASSRRWTSTRRPQSPPEPNARRISMAWTCFHFCAARRAAIRTRRCSGDGSISRRTCCAPCGQGRGVC
jgi:arylsulfatase A-like enzyme